MNPVSDETLTVGVDLGATKIAFGLVQENGQILNSHRFPTDKNKSPAGMLNDLVSCMTENFGKEWQSVQALGIGIAGQVDFEGNVLSAPNLGWHGVPVKRILGDRLGIPVHVLNDVRASTWGEWRFGAGRNINDIVVLFIGTGVGGGIVSGGNILAGCRNTGGELGHLTIVTNGRQCTCSRQGCLEAYTGGWAIAARAREAVRADPAAGQYMLDRAGTLENLSALTVTEAFRNGDLFARSFMDETAHYLASGMASIVNACNPCLFILGGGVVEGFPELIGLVEPLVKNHVLESAAENLKIVKAQLGTDAGIIGAAYAAARAHGKKSP
jgi:glucokinase